MVAELIEEEQSVEDVLELEAGSMRPVQYEIVGIPPGVLMSNPSGMKHQGDTAGPGIGSKAKTVSPDVEAEDRAYRLPDGQLYIPTNHFVSAILHASRGQRIGSKAAAPIVQGAVFAGEKLTCALTNPHTSTPIRSYEIDLRRVVVMGKGIVRARPLIVEWATKLELEYDSDFINVAILDSLIDRAGRMAGVMDYRPAKRGPYGRFAAVRL